MTAKSKVLPPVAFVDNPHAPELFATEAAGFFIHDGIISITFASARVNHETSPGPVSRVVIGRLTMSTPGAQALAAGLYDFLKSRGLDPVPTPDDPRKLQ